MSDVTQWKNINFFEGKTSECNVMCQFKVSFYETESLDSQDLLLDFINRFTLFCK